MCIPQLTDKLWQFTKYQLTVDEFWNFASEKNWGLRKFTGLFDGTLMWAINSAEALHIIEHVIPKMQQHDYVGALGSLALMTPLEIGKYAVHIKDQKHYARK